MSGFITGLANMNALFPWNQQRIKEILDTAYATIGGHFKDPAFLDTVEQQQYLVVTKQNIDQVNYDAREPGLQVRNLSKISLTSS